MFVGVLAKMFINYFIIATKDTGIKELAATEDTELNVAK